MDSEEDIKLQHAIRTGRPETDQGPYYHNSWWESYKGSVKGKLGGVIIGATVGALVGVVAGGVLAAITMGALPAAGFATMVAGFAAAGLFYGQDEFGNVGTVTGAVAAAHEKSEQRMKAFESGKFSELSKEIGEIKSLLSGKKDAAATVSNKAADDYTTSHTNYRTTHCDEHCEPADRRWIYGKVALLGLGIGMAVGALLAASPAAIPMMTALGIEGALSTGTLFAASMTTFGLFGASFGINRDAFREVFDKTDLWFKGIFKGSNSQQKTASLKAETQSIENTAEKPSQAPIVTMVYQPKAAETQPPATFYRDRLQAEKLALLNMDHTKAIPH